MITIRFETFNDHAGIQIVEKAATATLRKTSHPNKRAIEKVVAEKEDEFSESDIYQQLIDVEMGRVFF